MTPTIPKVEPQRVRAGETWQWRRENLADYPAPTWTLKYALKNSAQHLEISATADGTMFAVSVSSTATAAVVAGKYRMVGYVEDASSPAQRFGVYNEEIIVDAAYANATAIDDRSHARKVLDAIQAVLEGRASKDQEEYSIGHRTLKRTPLAELKALEQQYRGEVAGEELAERVAAGLGGNKIVVRL
jgi:hypothetical protein